MRIWLILLFIGALVAGSAWWFIFRPGLHSAPPLESYMPGSSTLVIEHASIKGLFDELSDSTGVLNDFKVLRELIPGLSMLNATPLSEAKIIVCAGPDQSSFRFIIAGSKKTVKEYRASIGMVEVSHLSIPFAGADISIHCPADGILLISAGRYSATEVDAMDADFTAARNTLSDTCQFSIILRPQEFIRSVSTQWIASLKALTEQIIAHERWIALDLTASKNALWLNGVGLGDEAHELPLADNDLLRYIPGNASIAYVSSVKGSDAVQTGVMYCPNDVLDMVEEEDLFVLVKGIDWLTIAGNEKQYRGSTIQTVDIASIQKLVDISPAFEGEVHVLRMGDVGIIHPLAERLETLIEHYLADDRLVHNEQMQRALLKLSDASSTLIVRPQRLGKELTTMTGENGTQIQLVTLQSFNDLPGQRFYNLGVLHHLENKALVPTEWSLDLDTNAAAGPWRFENHTSGEAEFIVQDGLHQLYLVDANGRLLWKRKLDSTVVGNIQVVDVFNNSKKQILLSTASKVYMIDRKGRDLEGFPISSNNSAGATLVVYSADKQRLMVPAGNKLLNFDQTGSTVKGWKPKDFDTTITTAPMLVSFGSADYLLIQTADNKLHFLDPTGKRKRKSVQLAPGYERTWLRHQDLQSSILLNYDSLGNLNLSQLNGKTEVKNMLPLGPMVRMVAFQMNGIQHYGVLDGARYLTLNEEFEVILDYTLPERCDQLESLEYKQRAYIRVSNSQDRSTYLFLPKSGLIQNMPIAGEGNCLLSDTSVPDSPRVIICNDRTLVAYKPVLSAL